ncbi:hypothetical protein [Altererythrobacter sp. Root672]|uniref:hypothetical protein n=1 Tax=Altererythrobacter sp. Root672 TaxID=1736584 RepID=UPI000A45EB95|nr:hypothetical protein [Altererythrobacter sp. Root672]
MTLVSIWPGALTAPAPPTGPDGLYDRLRKLLRDCGPNKHDQAIVLITACVEEGITQGRDIVRTLQALGLNAQHVGKTLSDGTGNQPERHRWRKDAAGCYVNLV